MQIKHKLFPFLILPFAMIMGASGLTNNINTSTSNLLISTFDEIVIEEQEAVPLKETIGQLEEYTFDKCEEEYYVLDDAPIFTHPYDNLEEVGLIESGEKVLITGKNENDYWEATINGEKFFIPSKNLTNDKQLVFKRDSRVLYCIGNTNIREEPDGKSKVIKVLQQSTPVLVLSCNDDWCYITVDGIDGYVVRGALMYSNDNLLIDGQGRYIGNREATEDIVFNYLYDELQDLKIVCAIMGNFRYESDMCTYRYEGDGSGGFIDSRKHLDKIVERIKNEGYNESTQNEFVFNKLWSYGGYGLAQWTYFEWCVDLFNISKEMGLGLDDPRVQCELLLRHLKDHADDYENLGEMLKLMKEAKDVEDATEIFRQWYEKSAWQEYSIEMRKSYSRDYYNQYQTLF